MSDDAQPRDWPTIFAEVKAGVLSKGEICRKHNLSMQALNTKLAVNGIVHGSLLPQIEATVRANSAAVALLSDDEIIGAASQRSLAVIKSHLTLTRGLQARLAALIEGYDDVMHDAITIDSEGTKVIEPKKWLAAAQLLEGVTKIADRLTRMELNTFGVSALVGGSGSTSAPTSAAKAIEDAGDDAIEASIVYQRMMQDS